MNELDALDFANEQLRKHGLDEKGWTVELRPGILVGNYTVVAITHHPSKTIIIRVKFVVAFPVEQVHDAILHEVAHALTPRTAPHHGKQWKEIARRIGASPYANGIEAIKSGRGSPQKAGAA